VKTIVTTAYRPTEETKRCAKDTAQALGLTVAERNKRPIYKLHEELAADVLVCKKERLELYPVGQSEPFFFHPNSAAFRSKRPLANDPLIEVSGLVAGDSFLDCTLGMASDALIASLVVGDEGRVVGCESDPIIGHIVREGLRNYQDMLKLHESMRRIEVEAAVAVDFLRAQQANSFDVVYMDPMFTEEITEASNFAPLRSNADPSQLSAEWVAQAKRVARKSVVLKAHFRSNDFEAFGFTRRVRPNTKFHFGVIHINKSH
jgi:16S rRNA (guanine1516-N2)-methyltransferase